MRYWLTAGPGNLGVTPDGCTTALYILVFGGLPSDPAWSRDGIAEATVPTSLVPLKPRMCATSTHARPRPARRRRGRVIAPSTCHRLAELKSNNYLLNALTAMAARDRGGKFGIVTQDDGAIHDSATRIVVVVVVVVGVVAHRRPHSCVRSSACEGLSRACKV